MQAVVTQLAWLALAGAVGTLCRYGSQVVVHRICGESFPWGTVFVNLVGCFLFGLVWTLAEERHVVSHQTRFIMLTGFMGAFTTFSTFGFETAEQVRLGHWLSAVSNVMLQNGLGLVAVFTGFAVGRSV